MDTETIGALMLIEDYYYIHNGIPKTDAECARVCKLSARKFARIRSALFSGFDDEGRNEQLDASIEDVERILSSRRDAGRKGGTGKALAFAKAELKQNRSEPEPEPEPELELEKEEKPESSSKKPSPPPSSGPRASEAEEIAVQVLAPLPLTARAHPGWRGLRAWIGALLCDGAHPADIVIGIAQCLRSLKDEPPSTFCYFDKAIERARAARTAALPEIGRPVSDQHELGPAGETLKNLLGRDVFAAWFGGSRLLDISGSAVTISVSTELKRSRILTNFEVACVKAFDLVQPPIDRLVIAVEAKPDAH